MVGQLCFCRRGRDRLFLLGRGGNLGGICSRQFVDGCLLRRGRFLHRRFFFGRLCFARFYLGSCRLLRLRVGLWLGLGSFFRLRVSLWLGLRICLRLRVSLRLRLGI